MVLTSLVVHFKVVCRNGSSQFCLHKLNAFTQAVPLLGGLPCFAAVTRELLSLQPECRVPRCHPAQDLVGTMADSCRWSWAAPPRRRGSPCSKAVGREEHCTGIWVLWIKLRNNSGSAEGEVLLPVLVHK